MATTLSASSMWGAPSPSVTRPLPRCTYLAPFSSRSTTSSSPSVKSGGCTSCRLASFSTPSSSASTFSLAMCGTASWAMRARPFTSFSFRSSCLARYGLFALGLVGAALATFSLLSHGGYLREAYLSQATAARPLVWEMSEKAIADRPILGWGADNFQRVFEKHYDNRLLQGEYGNEAWFDRAHNVFIDQLVDNGFVGLAMYFAVYIVVILALIYTALHAAEKRDRIFAVILIVYFTLHIAELQTAFDTSISYPMLAFMFVSAAFLYHRTRRIKKPNLSVELPLAARYAVGIVLIGFFSWSLTFGALPFARAQIANGEIRKVGSAEKRMPLYPAPFGTRVDQQEFLWRTVTDFERGIG